MWKNRLDDDYAKKPLNYWGYRHKAGHLAMSMCYLFFQGVNRINIYYQHVKPSE